MWSWPGGWCADDPWTPLRLYAAPRHGHHDRHGGGLRSFLFDAVYENDRATSEFKKASGILCGLWEKVREHPDDLLDSRIVAGEGLDVATRSSSVSDSMVPSSTSSSQRSSSTLPLLAVV